MMDIADIHILSTGTVLPGPPIENATLARHFRMNSMWEQWVDAFVGTKTRHLAIDIETGEICYSLADLGVTAASRALAAAGLDASTVDLVVMATSTPDHLMPATVTLVADRLGIDGVPTYQLQSGCTGAVQALDVARALLLAGGRRTALVIGADTCAKHVDLGMNLGDLTPAELVNVVLFGDGAGAAVLSTEPVAGSALLRRVFVQLAGLGQPPGHTVEWFGLADRNSNRPAGSEDYKAIEEKVPALSVEILAELLGDLGWKEPDLDYLLPPQLSVRMTARIVKELNVPDAQEVSCIAETGNTGNALPFFQVEQVLPLMTAGQRAIGISVESSKWIKGGFALEGC
jgi:3-oxoacyl-[acyl-carrier-protein] synthase-3